MKRLLLIVFVLGYTCTGYTQAKLQQLISIDSLTRSIDMVDLPVKTDSVVQDLPDIGLHMKTWLSATFDGQELRKYVNKVQTVTTEKGIAKTGTTCNTFYYHHNKLVKVEEWGEMDGKKAQFDWYFAEGKPLYYTLQSDKAAERAALLLTMGEGILKQMSKQGQ